MDCLLVRFVGVFAFLAATLHCIAADRILFDRLAPAQSILFLSKADGSGERPLTQPGSLNYNPTWSPNGDWIAFTSERAGPVNLFRMHHDGSDVQRLTDASYDDQAAFSPDGAQIVFVSTRAAGFANLWILEVATRKARALTTGRGGDFRPAWSPDGQWIAFSSDRDSSLPTAKSRWERLHLVDIYLVHPDGSGLKRISRHGDFCGTPQWTADSKSVVTYCMSAQDTWTYRTKLLTPYAAGGENQLYRIDIHNDAIVPVTSGPGVKVAPSVLASGRIAYLRGNGAKIEVISGDNKVGPSGTDMAPNPVAWSPDGTHVVYCRQTFQPSSVPAKRWSRDPKFDLYATTALPAYDRTGTHLAVSDVVPGGITSLVIFDGDKPGRAILKRNDLILAPQWSPDASQIVVGVGGFTAFLDFAAGTKTPIDRVNGGAQVAILNADGTGFHVVTSGPNNNSFASFSPDGGRIVYRTAGPDGQGLRLMNLANHSVTALTDEWDNFPVWSPRGDLIAFVRNVDGDFEVMTIHPYGKQVRQLTHTHGNEAHLAWSPDGERLLFTSSRMGFKDEALYTGAPQPYGEIFVMDKDGSHVEQITDDQWEEGGPAWRPPGATSTTPQVAVRPAPEPR